MINTRIQTLERETFIKVDLSDDQVILSQRFLEYRNGVLCLFSLLLLFVCLDFFFFFCFLSSFARRICRAKEFHNSCVSVSANTLIYYTGLCSLLCKLYFHLTPSTILWSKQNQWC